MIVFGVLIFSCFMKNFIKTLIVEIVINLFHPDQIKFSQQNLIFFSLIHNSNLIGFLGRVLQTFSQQSRIDY